MTFVAFPGILIILRGWPVWGGSASLTERQEMTIRKSRSIVIIYDAIDRLDGIKQHTPKSAESTIRKMMAAEVLSSDFDAARKELTEALVLENRV